MATILHLDGETVMYSKLAKLAEVGDATKDVAERGQRRAAANLASVRATTTHVRIDPPAHQYDTDDGAVRPDAWFSLEGPNAMALEFGHYPSGYFAPEKYGSVTKAPAGVYILSGAASSITKGKFMSLSITPAGKR